MSTWNLSSGIVYDTDEHVEAPPARTIPPADKLAAVESSPGSPATPEGHSGPGACLAAMDELQVYTLTDTDSQVLGEVRSFIVDLHQGRLAYVVVALSGAKGAAQLTAVPWHALAHAPHERRFVLNTTQADPAKAPAFDAAAWPDMSNCDWAQSLHDFYQARPYWL
ncbi:PRC-barrel domain-containing protein [Chitiniphilus eburneus]|uniref:PRC-barrel domain containing protein n=1 Tax=Chitiniphilus eburneus TaxID=2571148 RepID=A0A4U0PP79_9NEIS|nr:PRC-barrel domain-containing protein [Chitiniphilus eburneus]TJZ70056.1 PRC-barrel domain containing protein [Chitiniphilus eburneus]